MAGALWGPWLAEPRNRVLRWAEHTLATLRHLATHRGTGVRLASGIDVSDVRHDPPDWAYLLPDRRPCAHRGSPPGTVHRGTVSAVVRVSIMGLTLRMPWMATPRKPWGLVS